MSYTAYVSRINQLDAQQLDHEIDRIILSRITNIFQFFMPTTIQMFTPELNAILRASIGIFSLGTSKSTFGQKLLDLTYADLTRTKASLLLLFSVLSKYLNDKYLDDNRINEHKIIRENLEKIVNVLRIINLINLLIFLNRAHYPSVMEKILGIANYNAANNKARTIGYSYMTRELLWHGLMELFTTGIPAINLHSLKQYFQRSKHNEEQDIQSLITPQLTLKTFCPYCKENPILPYHAGCRDVYCYYCLRAHFTTADTFNCLSCGVKLHSYNMKMITL